MRWLVLTCCLLAPALASADEVCGRVVVEGARTFLETAHARVPLAADALATEQARQFPGREVVVEGEIEQGLLLPARLVSPTRETRVGRPIMTDTGLRLHTADGAPRVLNRDHPLLRGADVSERVWSVWRFPEGVWLEGIEGQTVQDWTLLRIQPRHLAMPNGYVRSRRAVWILDVEDGYVRIRYGDKVGWAEQAAVERLPAPPPGPVVEPAPDPTAGLTDLVPIPLGGDAE